MSKKTTKPIDLKAIKRRNPQIDDHQVAQTLKLIEALRESGITEAGYGLESPFSRRMSQPANWSPALRHAK